MCKDFKLNTKAQKLLFCQVVDNKMLQADDISLFSINNIVCLSIYMSHLKSTKLCPKKINHVTIIIWTYQQKEKSHIPKA